MYRNCYRDPPPHMQQLTFDSALLGCPVGRIQSETLTPDELQQTIAKAEAEGFRLLFWKLETSHPASKEIESVIMLKGGYFLCEKLTYRTELSKSITLVMRHHLNVRGIECSAFADAEPTPDMITLAIAAGRYPNPGPNLNPNLQPKPAVTPTLTPQPQPQPQP